MPLYFVEDERSQSKVAIARRHEEDARKRHCTISPPRFDGPAPAQWGEAFDKTAVARKEEMPRALGKG